MTAINTKTLLISLPWADYASPSYQIAHMSAYARSKGFSIEAKHLHIEAAEHFGFDDYEMHSLSYGGSLLGESLALSNLHGDLACRKLLSLKDIKRCRRLKNAMLRVYGQVSWSDYDLIGFTSCHSQIFTLLLMAQWIKRDYPDKLTIVGGAPVSMPTGASILEHYPQIDWCVDGEGESTLVKLLDNLEKQRPDVESTVPGLIYRRGGEIICNRRKQLTTLRNLPDPDYDDYFRRVERLERLGTISISASIPLEVGRGCAYRCAFCCDNNYFSGVRRRPPLEVAASIDRLFRKYKPSSIVFICQEISGSHGRVLFNALASHNRDYKIFCETRAEVTKAQLKMMKRAGVCEVQIGIEAFDSTMLRKMNKGTRFIDNLKAMKYCEELGIKNSANLVVGFPLTDREDIQRNIKNMEYALSYEPLNISRFTLFQGSQSYIFPHKYGIKRIFDSRSLRSRIPRKISKRLILPYKEFRGIVPALNYSNLERSVGRWRDLYANSRQDGLPLLYYLQSDDFIEIVDHRDGQKSVKIDGWRRMLYVFCDEIRSIADIYSKYSDVPRSEIDNYLNEMFSMKLMYSEGGDYLSLAIHASSDSRRNMPFM